jgi:hypothetical protein
MSGDVVGVVSGKYPESEGMSFAVEPSTAAPWYAAPTTSHPAAAVPACADPLGPDVSGDDGTVPFPAASGVPAGVTDTFRAYFGGINSGDYATAWQQLSPRRRGDDSGLDRFAAAVRTSFDDHFVVQQASYTAATGEARVWLEFVSLQDGSLGPNPGETCTNWSIDYVLVEQPGGTFLIDQVDGHGGTSGHEACL